MTNPTTTIKIIKPDGTIADKEVPLVVAYTDSLAITGSAHDPEGLSITHLPTGRSIGGISHRDQGELTQLIDRLAALPGWDAPDALTPEGLANPHLAIAILEITSDWRRTFQGVA